MRKRALVIPIAAVAIAALCAYRVSREDRTGHSVAAPPAERRPAALFELYDYHSPQHLVRLGTYLGRHPILLVFFDARLGPDADPIVSRIVKEHEQIRAADTILLAVTDAIPQEVRKAFAPIGEPAFPVLTDESLDVHRAWGRLDKATGKPVPGIFLIDRAGRVAVEHGHPQPLAKPGELIDYLLRG